MTRILIVLMLCGIAQAAQIVRYVDTGSAGGDGTTNAVSGASAAYASLSACLTAEAQNLTDNGGDTMLIRCRRTNGGGLDGAAAVTTGWTTNATSYITITATDFPTDGIYDPNAYAITQADGVTLSIAAPYTRLVTMQIVVTTTTGTGNGVSVTGVPTGASDIRIANCIIQGNCAGTGSGYGVVSTDPDNIIKIYNTLILDIVSGTDAGFQGVRLSAGVVTLYNCTIYNCRYGIYQLTGGTGTAVNCAIDGTTDDVLGTWSVSYCCSGDLDGEPNTAPNGGSWSNEFTNIGGGNYSLKSGANCIGAGTNDPGSGLYSTDILGQTRTSPWDIGAFEYISGSTPGGAMLGGNYRRRR